MARLGQTVTKALMQNSTLDIEQMYFTEDEQPSAGVAPSAKGPRSNITSCTKQSWKYPITQGCFDVYVLIPECDDSQQDEGLQRATEAGEFL